MRYTLLIAAVAMLASTSIGLANSKHHHASHFRPGYAAAHHGVVPVFPGVSASENAWMDYVSRPSPGL